MYKSELQTISKQTDNKYPKKKKKMMNASVLTFNILLKGRRDEPNMTSKTNSLYATYDVS